MPAHADDDQEPSPGTPPAGGRAERRGRLRRWWGRRSARTRRRLVRLGWALVVLAIFHPILGVLGVPWLVRSVVLPRIERSLHGRVTVDAVHFQPYTCRLTLDGLRVIDDAGEDALACDHVDVDFNPLSSLVLPGWRFNDILLDHPRLHAVERKEGGLNLARLIASDATAAPDPAAEAAWRLPRFIVGSFAIQAGQASFEDRSLGEPARSHVEGVSFRLEELDTTPPPLTARGGGEALHTFRASTDGGATIEWSGTISLDPLVSKGFLVVRDASLPNIGAYATRLTDVTIREGRLSTLLTYHLAPFRRVPTTDPSGPAGAAPSDPSAPPPTRPAPILRATIARASIDGLVTERGGQPFAAAPSILLRGADIDLVQRRAVVEILDVDGGSLLVERDGGGIFNLARLLRDPTGGAGPNAPPRVDPTRLADPAQQIVTSTSYLLEDLVRGWDIRLEELSIARQSLRFRDAAVAPSVDASCKDLFLLAGPVHTADRFAIPFDLTTALNGADLGSRGTFLVRDRVIDTQVQTSGLELPAFAGYLRLVPFEPFPHAELVAGRATVRAQMRLATPDPRRIEGSWVGSLDLEGLATRAGGEDLLAIGSLHAEGSTELDLGGGASGAGSGAAQGALAITGVSEGTLEIHDGRAGPTLLRTLGLGEADARGDRLALRGTGRFARPRIEGSSAAADLRVGWSGSVQGDRLAASHLLAGGVAGADVDAAAQLVDGTLEADLVFGTDGHIDGRWSGPLTLADAFVDAHGADPGHLALEAATIGGEGTIGLSAEQVLTLGWTGTANATRFDGAAGDSLAWSVGALGVDGSAMLMRGRDVPASIRWTGSATVEEGSLHQGDGAGEVALAETSLRFDGAADARLHPGGGAEASINGSLAVDGGLATLPRGAEDEPRRVASAGHLSFAGSGHAAITPAQGEPPADAQLTWKAKATLDDVAVVDRPAESDPTAPVAIDDDAAREAGLEQPDRLLAEGAFVSLDGDGTAAFVPDLCSLTWQGRGDARGLRAAGGGEGDATLGSAGLDGALRLVVQPAAEGRTGIARRWEWTGHHRLAALDASIATSADDDHRPLELRCETSEGTSTLALTVEESSDPTAAAAVVRRTLTLDGPIDAGARGLHGALPPLGSFGAADARLVGGLWLRTPLAAGGDAAQGVRPEVRWTGSADLAGVSAEHGAGAERWSASAERIALDEGTLHGDVSPGPADGGPDAPMFASTASGSLRIDGLKADHGEQAATGSIAEIHLDRFRWSSDGPLLGADRLALRGVVVDAPVERPAEGDGHAPSDASAADADDRVSNRAPKGTAPSIPGDGPLGRRLPITLRLGTFALSEGSIRVTGTADGSADGTPQTVTLDQLAVTIEDLTTDGVHVAPAASPDGAAGADQPPAETATSAGGSLTLTGRLVGSGRVDLRGTVDPFRSPPTADVVLTLESMPLPPVDPIASRYVGYQLAAGRLSTRIPAAINAGTIRGEIDFRLDGVELGARSKHPEAPDLPLGFALAIMRDANDQVRGTIPFSGDVTSPDFSLSGLILEVILSFIGKIATAPFQLLASAFAGGESIDLSHVAFRPGDDVLDADALHRIDLLTKALVERPGLRLEVVGQVEPASDEDAIRHRLLAELAVQRAQNTTRPVQHLDPARYRWLVGVLYREREVGAEEADGGAAPNADSAAEPTFETMERVMLARVPFTPALLDDLAARRAEAVYAAFVGAGIDAARLSRRPPTSPEERAPATPRAGLLLGAPAPAAGEAGS